MGYMGFGLQRWIYTQKPRKPYIFGNRSAKDSQIFHDHKKYNDKFFNKKSILNNYSIKSDNSLNFKFIIALSLIVITSLIFAVWLSIKGF
jgi:hypothetical protein